MKLDWQSIADIARIDGAEVVVRLKNSHPRMPPEFLGNSVHQIGTWVEGDLWVRGVKIEDILVEGIVALPQGKP